jgi:triosephosphate isomerase
MGTLVVNFKNYPEVQGDRSVKLARSAERVAERSGVVTLVAPPAPMLAVVSSSVRIGVYSQSVSSEVGDRTTGAVLPEAVKAAGAIGTILNHSESRRTLRDIKKVVPRLRSLSMEGCLCARTAAEAATLARFGTKYLAVEPPELIGSGIAVSKARPALIARTVAAARKAGYRGEVLCGAGIASGNDVAKAVELGAEGVLVSSSVVRARDWDAKLDELARSLK